MNPQRGEEQMKEFLQFFKNVDGVVNAAVIDSDGIIVASANDTHDAFLAVIPFINRMKEALENLGGTLEELIVSNNGQKMLIKEKDGLFFCVLYSPDKGAYDGKVKHFVEKALKNMGV